VSCVTLCEATVWATEHPGTCNAFCLRMFTLAVGLAVAPALIAIYAYGVYPAILWIVGRLRSRAVAGERGAAWPTVTITVPVYNAAASIRTTLTHLLEVDYPRELIQLLVLSDASNDGTDQIVREFASRGVELLRAPVRLGKTAAENAAVSVARGELIVNVDATITVPASSLRHLVRAFEDPTVGVASGCDVSIGAGDRAGTRAESGYTGYEMWLRDLETKAGSIVGASGCFYGIRRRIRAEALPPELSWDFASTLVAKQQGYRSVSVPDAVCFVPRAVDVQVEFRRKSRTMARGLSTLFHFAELMDPFRYGGFALMLVSHKLLRWLPFLLAPVAGLALIVLALQSSIAALALAVVAVGLLVGIGAITHRGSAAFKPVAVAGFAVAAAAAGLLAWRDALRGTRLATWEPTPRPSASAG
jgi:cellulose synthase/poly-beta-1,6-N-acetylglucosamine synthase-like glycosyltransferase